MYQLFLTDHTGMTSTFPDLTPGAGVVRAAGYVPVVGDGARVREEITLRLEGLPGEIETLMTRINRALVQAAREAGIPGGDTVYLACQVTAGDGVKWRSPILRGSLRLGKAGADTRAQGVQDCVLSLERADYWERMDPAQVYTVNALTAGGRTAPLQISNHADAGHLNVVDIPARVDGVDCILGDLPAPAQVICALASAASVPVTFVAGQSRGPLADSLSPSYPGESGSARGSAAGTVTSDAACAGGQYLNLAWNGAADGEVFSFSVPFGDAQKIAGGAVRVVMRLQAPVSTASTEKLWYRWKIYTLRDGLEYLAGESASQYMEQGAELILGPVIHLPPWLVDQAESSGVPDLRLALSVQAAGSGAHGLKIDAVHLLGLNGWRIYRPLTGEPGEGFNDNGPRGTVSSSALNEKSHAEEGPGFVLQPGQAHRFTFFALRHDAAEKAAPIDLDMYVLISYRARKRTL